jgi:hypothetical protein
VASVKRRGRGGGEADSRGRQLGLASSLASSLRFVLGAHLAQLALDRWKIGGYEGKIKREEGKRFQ